MMKILPFIFIFCVGLAEPLVAEEKSQSSDIPPAPVAAYGPSNIYVDIYKVIMETAGLDVVYKAMNYKEIREEFLLNKVQITCCTSPLWRDLPEEKKVQLFSRPFFYIFNKYAIHSDVAIEDFDPKDKNNIAVLIKGWTYAAPLYTRNVIYVNSVNEALNMVHNKKADFTTINTQEFLQLNYNKNKDVHLAGVYDKSSLNIRLHKSRAELMPAINDAIKKLRRQKTIQRMIAASIRGKELPTR